MGNRLRTAKPHLAESRVLRSRQFRLKIPQTVGSWNRRALTRNIGSYSENDSSLVKQAGTSGNRVIGG